MVKIVNWAGSGGVAMPCSPAQRGEVEFQAMRVVLAMGDVEALATYLSNEDVLAHGRLNHEAASKITQAKTWYSDAVIKEQREGPGAAANREHPLWREFDCVDDWIAEFRSPSPGF